MEIKLQLSRKPTGKISQLPPALLDYVNCAIQDGARYETIAKHLAEKGFPGFNKWNLSRWRRSGHAQWLLAQDRRDALRIQSEAALDTAEGIDEQAVAALNEKLVAMQLADTLWAFRATKTDLTKKPEHFLKLATLVCQTSREHTRSRRIAFEIERLRRNLEREGAPLKR